VSRRSLSLRRLAALGIQPAAAADPAAAVRALCAVQAQDYQSALWAVGLRVPGARREDVEAAVTRRAIVRTWPMRGTLHFVAAEDVRWMLALLTPRVIASTARRRGSLGLDDAALGAGRRLVEAALSEGPVARPELFERLRAGGFEPGGQRGYHLLLLLAMLGVVCQGPIAGKQPTFVLLEDWLAPALSLPREALPREEALRRLALRYFAGHGPATVKDLSWWSGLTLRDCRAALDAVELTAEVVDGLSYYDIPREPPAPAAGCHLLPAFDEHLLGYTDRSVTLDPMFAKRVSPGGGVFRNTVVSDGKVVGTWTRALRRASLTVNVSCFEAGDAAALDGAPLVVAAGRYSAFMGLTEPPSVASA